MLRYLGVLFGVCLVSLGGGHGQAAVQCDGSDDLLTQALSLDAFINADAFTVLALVAGSGSVFTSTDCWNEGPFFMEVDENLAIGRAGTTGAGDACLSAYDSGGGHQIVSPIWVGFFHIAARLSSGTLTLFINGFAQGTPVTMGPLSAVSSALQLCGGLDGHSPDRLLDITVYDVPLTDAMILAKATDRLSYAVRGSPTAYWPLDDCPDGASGEGLPFRDRSGNNRHLLGAHGGNGSGLSCHSQPFLSRPWGIQ